MYNVSYNILYACTICVFYDTCSYCMYYITYMCMYYIMCVVCHVAYCTCVLHMFYDTHRCCVCCITCAHVCCVSRDTCAQLRVRVMPAIARLRLGCGGPGKAGHLGVELRWDLGPAGGLGRVFRLRLVQVEPACSCLPFPGAHTTCNGLVRRGLWTAEGAFALPGTSLSLERSKASFPRPQVPWTRGRVWPHGHQTQVRHARHGKVRPHAELKTDGG